MFQTDSTSIDSQPESVAPEEQPADGSPSAKDAPAAGIDIQRELNQIEDIILDSPRIPLTRRTLIDEEPLLDRLDAIRLNLPAAFQEAEALLRRKDEIVLQAQQYAKEIVEAAERQATDILDEMGLVRQAKIESDRLRAQVQQECDAAREQTIAEIEQLHARAREDLEQARARAINEARAIEAGADEYADRVLRNIEQQLTDMTRVIRNGRQQLQSASAARHQGPE